MLIDICCLIYVCENIQLDAIVQWIQSQLPKSITTNDVWYVPNEGRLPRHIADTNIQHQAVSNHEPGIDQKYLYKINLNTSSLSKGILF